MKLIKIYSLLITGSGIFCALFYWRFLRERPLGNLGIEFSFLRILLYGFSICLMIFTIYNIFIPSMIISDNNTPNVFVQKLVKLKNLLDGYYTDFVQYFYAYILYKFPIYLRFINFITPLWYKYPQYYPVLINILIFFPPLLISFFFFVDVVMLKKFVFFPKAIFLLLFTIIIKFIAFSIKEGVQEEIDNVERNIKYDPTLPEGTQFYIREELWEILPALASTIYHNLNLFITQYALNLKYLEYSSDFDLYIKNSYPKKYYLLLSSFLWIISWMDMIIYMVQKF